MSSVCQDLSGTMSNFICQSWDSKFHGYCLIYQYCVEISVLVHHMLSYLRENWQKTTPPLAANQPISSLGFPPTMLLNELNYNLSSLPCSTFKAAKSEFLLKRTQRWSCKIPRERRLKVTKVQVRKVLKMFWYDLPNYEAWKEWIRFFQRVIWIEFFFFLFLLMTGPKGSLIWIAVSFLHLLTQYIFETTKTLKMK